MLTDPFITCIPQFLTGDILGAAFCPFISLMGLDITIAFFMVIGVGLAYMKTGELEVPAFILIIGGGVSMAAVAPETRLYFAIMLILGIVAGVYSFYKSK